MTIVILIVAQMLVIGFLLVFHFRRQRATKLLREREARFRALLDAPLETIALLDHKGTLLDINDSGARRFGSTPEALVGRNVYELMPAEVAQHRKSNIERVLRTGETVRFEDKRAGTWYANSIYPFTAGKGGKIPGVIVFSRNISEWKHAEEALTGSEQRFRQMVEQSPLAIEILLPDGRIDRVNPAWLRLWGLTPEESFEAFENYNMLTDKQTEDLGIAPLIRKAFAGEAVVLPPVSYSSTRTMEDIGLDHIKGRAVWIQCHLYPVKDQGGEVKHVVNTYMDITELRNAEQEAREQRDALARVGRAQSMGQLTGSIAHELNQPLTGILSNAQAAELLLLNNQGDCEVLAEIIAAIVADTKRAGSVIRNLRELYREQKGEFQPVDLHSIVDETLELLQSEIVARRVALATDHAESLPTVNGNRTQLQQVLVNLLMNALEALRNVDQGERRILLATTYTADGVTATVEDSGPGIDEEKIDTIFEPLATWKPGGTGMGLAICNSIIKAHGGRMWAEISPGGGARVGFSIPAVKGEG